MVTQWLLIITKFNYIICIPACIPFWVMSKYKCICRDHIICIDLLSIFRQDLKSNSCVGKQEDNVIWLFTQLYD